MIHEIESKQVHVDIYVLLIHLSKGAQHENKAHPAFTMAVTILDQSM